MAYGDAPALSRRIDDGIDDSATCLVVIAIKRQHVPCSAIPSSTATPALSRRIDDGIDDSATCLVVIAIKRRRIPSSTATPALSRRIDDGIDDSAGVRSRRLDGDAMALPPIPRADATSTSRPLQSVRNRAIRKFHAEEGSGESAGTDAALSPATMHVRMDQTLHKCARAYR
jgi:hypothetical protein